ncbi:hypothetical protein [Pseudomonas moorei]|uniref:hypothetical protein n=1 Tax=Pseudomonas moorei TaxID=395599 RepID=UPI001FF55E95|nr:hypothetical protein [Pseudomonas moorei]
MARSMVAPRTAADTPVYNNATSRLINTCHALREDSPIAVFLKKQIHSRRITLLAKNARAMGAFRPPASSLTSSAGKLTPTGFVVIR